MLKLTIGILLLSSIAFAQTEPTKNELSDEKAKFCSEKLDSPTAIQDLLYSNQNQIAFVNQGGLIGGGVCWWHSRFTRNAAYLAFFRPELPKPSELQAKAIVKNIRKGKFVEIPGYKNLRAFSSDFANIVQEQLNAWQRFDGMVKQKWTQGLSGSSKAQNADKFEADMDALYERVQKGEVVFQMLQLKGIVAHAWLVIKMIKVENGYDLEVLDSNLGVDTYQYRKGMESFEYHHYGEFMPYTHEVKEEVSLRRKLMKVCDRKVEQPTEVVKEESNEEVKEEPVEEL